MDTSESIVAGYLTNVGFREIVYEPDGNVPPDFLVDNRIAVEVRRLNRNEDTSGAFRGLEEVSIPLQKEVKKLLHDLGASKGESWLVHFTFRRPLSSRKKLAKALESKLVAFRDSSEPRPAHGDVISLNVPSLRLLLTRAVKLYPDFFVYGGYTDKDSWAFALPELRKNILVCVQEKTRKVSPFRKNHPEWWLILVDHIKHELSGEERRQLRELLQLDQTWGKVVIVASSDPAEAYEL